MQSTESMWPVLANAWTKEADNDGTKKPKPNMSDHAECHSALFICSFFYSPEFSAIFGVGRVFFLLHHSQILIDLIKPTSIGTIFCCSANSKWGIDIHRYFHMSVVVVGHWPGS